ncbi:MAG: pyruvate formate lyase family protein, partial [Syntrophaceae bacterium]
MQENMPADKKSLADTLAYLFLQFFALNFNVRPGLKKYLRFDEGWFDFTFGIKTENGSVEQAIGFHQGKVRVLKEIPQKPDAQLIFVDEDALKEAAVQPPNKLMAALMENRMVTRGNLGYLQLMNFYLSLLLKPVQIAKLKKEARKEKRDYDVGKASEKSINSRILPQLRANMLDPGVAYLTDPYLADYSLNDFPRLKDFLDIHLKTRPALCHERPELLTRWYKANGFETAKNGSPLVAELRQAQAFKYLMENRQPVIRTNDLIAGTTTTKEIGVVLYPDA